MSSSKKVYLAAPFFTPAQVSIVDMVERAIRRVDGLELYSPREDGVLQDMTPEERLVQAPATFARNVAKILWSDVMVVVMNEKDTGTIWEHGAAWMQHILKRPDYRVIGFYTNNTPMNVMLQQSLHAVTHSAGDLEHRLSNYVQGKLLRQSQPKSPEVY